MAQHPDADLGEFYQSGWEMMQYGDPHSVSCAYGIHAAITGSAIEYPFDICYPKPEVDDIIFDDDIPF